MNHCSTCSESDNLCRLRHVQRDWQQKADAARARGHDISAQSYQQWADEYAALTEVVEASEVRP